MVEDGLLDWVILEVFPNLGDSMTQWFYDFKADLGIFKQGVPTGLQECTSRSAGWWSELDFYPGSAENMYTDKIFYRSSKWLLNLEGKEGKKWFRIEMDSSKQK